MNVQPSWSENVCVLQMIKFNFLSESWEGPGKRYSSFSSPIILLWNGRRDFNISLWLKFLTDEKFLLDLENFYANFSVITSSNGKEKKDVWIIRINCNFAVGGKEDRKMIFSLVAGEWGGVIKYLSLCYWNFSWTEKFLLGCWTFSIKYFGHYLMLRGEEGKDIDNISYNNFAIY